MCLQEENSEDPLREVSASMSLYWLYICKWLPSSKALKCMLSSSTAWLQQCWHVWGIHMPGERHMLVCHSGLTNSSLCPTGLWPGVWVRCPAPMEGIEDGNGVALHLSSEFFIFLLDITGMQRYRLLRDGMKPTSNACNFTLPGALRI